MSDFSESLLTSGGSTLGGEIFDVLVTLRKVFLTGECTGKTK